MSEKKVTFGKIFWPSLIAALIMSVVGTVIWLIAISGLIGSFGEFDGKKPFSVKSNTILHMELDGRIGERSSSKFDPYSFQMNNSMGLSEILYGIKNASEDKKIKGIFIDLKGVSCGIATAREIRKALLDFQESGKFLVAYNSGEGFSQLQYYLSSAAKENYGFHSSTFQFLGLGGEMMFFKNALDKIDVEMQVIRGSNNHFKSAVEPYFLDHMSDSSRLQTERYMNDIWYHFRKDIGASRSISIEKLDQFADNVTIQSCEDAVENGMMDGVKYRDEMMKYLAEKVNKSVDDMELLSFSKYAKKKFIANQEVVNKKKGNIAVILAEGGISTSGDGLTSKDVCKLLKDARENEDIKIVVFRVNSPGGSALASDEIWREVKLTNEKKKVIVSMGDVAASGGYYISAPATRIFAEPTTITGSIGVFGVIPFTGKMLENKLGLTFDRASTNKHSVMTTNKKLTAEEFDMIQSGVDDIYHRFKTIVAEGRGMTIEQVDVVARGRVWTGADALKIGLVDELGGLKEAIAYAQKLANIEEAELQYYPEVKQDKFAAIFEQLEEMENETEVNAIQLPATLVEAYQQLEEIQHHSGIQMRMPYITTIR